MARQKIKRANYATETKDVRLVKSYRIKTKAFKRLLAYSKSKKVSVSQTIEMYALKLNKRKIRGRSIPNKKSKINNHVSR